MQRRELLENMLNTALAMGLITPLSLAAATESGAAPGNGAETAQWLEQELRRLAARDSSEQSVPMLLSLENLGPDGSAAVVASEPLNPELVARFEQYADMLLQFKSNPDEIDAVSLIVLMARRDLAPGAVELCW